MSKVRQFVFILLSVVLLVVMIQNAQPVKFRFLNWTYDVSQLLLVLIVLVLGFVLGFATARWPRRKPDDYPPTQTRR